MNQLAIPPEELWKELASEEGPILIDIRREEERNLCRIEKSLWIPVLDLPLQVDRLFGLGQLVVFCHYGVRSREIAKWLRELGIAARFLTGGAASFISDENG